jgi:hypothetical protein
VHLLLGGAVLVLIVLLSVSTPGSVSGKKQLENTVLGALAVGAMVLVLTKAGMPWLAVALALLLTSAKRFAGRARGAAAKSPPAGGPSSRGASDRMTREEAYRVLGLSPGASREAVVAEYRRLMKRVHPDQGGTDYLAAQLNEAKDTLLEG